MKDKIQQLTLAIQIIENNLDFRVTSKDELYYIGSTLVTPKPYIHNYSAVEPVKSWGAICQALGNPKAELSLIPLEFPKLPDTEEWHNPDNLTPEQVGKEYRLLTKTEYVKVAIYTLEGIQTYDPWTKIWRGGSGRISRVPRNHPITITYHAKD